MLLVAGKAPLANGHDGDTNSKGLTMAKHGVEIVLLSRIIN